jgi:hypothetical protein
VCVNRMISVVIIMPSRTTNKHSLHEAISMRSATTTATYAIVVAVILPILVAVDGFQGSSSSCGSIRTKVSSFKNYGWISPSKSPHSIRPPIMESSHRMPRFLFGRRVSNTDDNNNNNAAAAATATAIETSPSSTTSMASTAVMNTVATTASTRRLGSQELLMLPRQYPIGKSGQVFPQMNHVSVVLVHCTDTTTTTQPNINVITLLRQAIDMVLQSHPLLSCRIQGNGEPVKRIDALQMVRSFTEPEPDPLTFVSGMSYTSEDILTIVNVVEEEDGNTDGFHQSWQRAFARDLDNGTWCNSTTGPLWKMEVHQSSSSSTIALLFAFNHAISDQGSANRLVDEILRHMAEMEESGQIKINPLAQRQQRMPVTVEDSVLGLHQRWSDVGTSGITLNTLQYVAGKAAEGFKNPVILPVHSTDTNDGRSPLTGPLSIISGRTAGGHDTESSRRKSTVQYRSLTKESTDALLNQCRKNGVSVSNALTAAVTYTASDFVGVNNDDRDTTTSQKRNYKILQSLDMRRFGAQLDRGETVACMAGSHDILHGPIPDRSGAKLRENPSEQRLQAFWNLASDAKAQFNDFLASDGPSHAVRVFDFAMTISDLNNLVHLTAQSKDTKGRAYSAGITNAGVYECQDGFTTEGDSQRRPLQIRNGRFEVEDIFYATPHVTSGCLYPVSAITVNGSLKLTFHPVEPIVDSTTSARFADAFLELLETISNKPVPHVVDTKETVQSFIRTLPTIAASLGVISVLSHANAWFAFLTSIAEMKAQTADPADFWSALNFWIFFAVGHPILQPILWISDVLHASPGPMVAGLVPFSFIVGNILAIAVFTISTEVCVIKN